MRMLLNMKDKEYNQEKTQQKKNITILELIDSKRKYDHKIDISIN